MTAREHAALASEILETLAKRDKELLERHRDASKQMEDYAAGRTKAWNAQGDWSVAVAKAHALAAIALYFANVPEAGPAPDPYAT